MSAAPAIEAAFLSWAHSELAGHYANMCPDEVMDHLVNRAWADLDLLGKLPAQSSDDLLLKIFPLLLATYEPKSGDMPMVPTFGENNGDPELLKSVVQDLARLSPAIAKMMAAPHFNTERRAA